MERWFIGLSCRWKEAHFPEFLRRVLCCNWLEVDLIVLYTVLDVSAIIQRGREWFVFFSLKFTPAFLYDRVRALALINRRGASPCGVGHGRLTVETPKLGTNSVLEVKKGWLRDALMASMAEGHLICIRFECRPLTLPLLWGRDIECPSSFRIISFFPALPHANSSPRHDGKVGGWVDGWVVGGGPCSWVFLFLDWCVGMQIRNRRRGTVYFSRDLLVSQKENKKLQWKMAATNQEMHPFFFQCFKNKKEWPYRKCPLSFFSWHHRGGSGTVTVETNSAYKFIFFLSQKVAVKRGEIQILRRFSDGELVTLDSWKKGLRGSVWLMIDERWPKSLIQNNSFFFVNIYMYIKRQQLRKIRTGSQSVKLMNYENVRRNSLQVRLDFNQSWPPWVALAGDGGFYWVLSLGFY